MQVNKKTLIIRPTQIVCIFLATILSISGCGSEIETSSYKLNGLFGYNFGDIPDFIPDSYLADDQTFKALDPQKEHPFTTYQITVTPKEHKVYGVMATSNSDFTLENCEKELKTFVTKLTEQYGQEKDIVIKATDDSWILREKDNRTVSLACSEERGFDSTSQDSNFQLSLVAQDKALNMEAYQDWQNRQKSDEKFQ